MGIGIKSENAIAIDNGTDIVVEGGTGVTVERDPGSELKMGLGDKPVCDPLCEVPGVNDSMNSSQEYP
ncbi:hypothetical protein EVAR_41270_1 [Eumeta japonica]|uniref:Uncharacterized protein n=1 Tax=Eumeta variegata TaxID=151549 RepID=A0A4C1X866_EUMVA|nr:hypothetical protein EVAR_41270_1 [Eumeta japonica]